MLTASILFHSGGQRPGLFFSFFLESCNSYSSSVTVVDSLVGLVVKASTSRAEDPGFESRLRGDFFGVESYQ